MSRQSSRDRIDARIAQWASQMPDVDTRGMAIIGRMRWLTLAFRPPIEQVFARHGLDSGEFDVLATLRRSGQPYRLRPTELYRWLMISSGGLTARLGKLSAGGLIERTPDPDDRRSIFVQLTARGSKLIESVFTEDMAVEAAILSLFDPTDLDELEPILRRMTLAVEEADLHQSRALDG